MPERRLYFRLVILSLQEVMSSVVLVNSVP